VDRGSAEFRELFDVAFVEERAASADYVSRDEITGEVEEALADQSRRIVVLRGDPGTGKTTLMSALALRHPEWPRYFIRRTGERDLAAAKRGGHDGGLASFLTTVGLQLAAVRPDLFPEDPDDDLDIRLLIERLGPGGRAQALRIERLLLHPFRRFAAQVRVSAGVVEGDLVGVYIGELGEAALEDPGALAVPALVAPLERLRRQAPDDRVVILLDGLDELRLRDAPLDVGRWLNGQPELPANLRLVVASRNDERLGTLRQNHEDSLTTVDASLNAAPDVRSYAAKVAAKPYVREILSEYGVREEEFAHRAATRADAVFQYVAFLDRALAVAAREDPHPADLGWLAAPVDEWPNGPAKLYARFLTRIRDQVRRVTLTAPTWDAIYLPLLGLLAVAYAPLPVAQLAAYAGMGDEQAVACEGALARLSQFVTGGPEPGYSLVHRSVAEYIVDPVTEPSLGRDEGTAHRQITGYAFSRYGAGHSWKTADAYLRTFLAAHAAAVGQLDDLIEDPWFLVAADPEELLATLENAVRAAPVAAVYRRVAPDLKRGDESAALAHLELIAREAGLDELAAEVAGMSGDRPWTTAWTRRDRIRVSGVVGRHEGGVTAIAVTPADIDGGGSLALTAGNDGRIRIWDPRRHAEVEPPLTPRESDSKITALAVGKLRSGEAFAVAGTFAGLVRAWNVATREPVCPPLAGAENAGFPRAVCALGDGRGAAGFAALCEGLDSLRAWNVARGVPLGPPVRIGGTITRAVVRDYGGRLLAAIAAPGEGGDDSVRVFDAVTWRPVGPWLGTGDEVVTAVALEEHEGKPVVVVRDVSLGVQVFDAETGTPWHERRILWDDDSDVVAVGRLDGELLFASAGRSGVIRLRRLDTAAPFAEVTAFENGNVLALSIARGRLVAAGVDYAGGQRRPVLRCWEYSPVHGFLPGSVVPAPGELTSFAEVIGSDGAVTVACCDERRLHLADAATGQVRETAPFGLAEGVRAIAAARLDDGTPIAVAGIGKTIRVWDLERGAELCPAMTAPGEVKALAVTRLNDELVVVSSCWRAGVQVWDLATGRAAGSPLPAVPEYTESMAVAAIGGGPVLLAGASGEVTGYDLATGELTGRLTLPAFAQPFELQVLDGADDGGAVVVAAIPLAGGIVAYDLGPHGGLAGQQARVIGVPDDLAALAVTRVGGHPAALCAGREGNLQIIDLGG
jgi:WD40 repeat protein